MIYDDVLRDLASRKVMPTKAPALTVMKEALARLKLSYPDPKRVIVVAGTNGKGSTCKTLERLLLDAGQSTGLYTSPHMVEITERIAINGLPISRDLFVQAFCAVQELLGAPDGLSHFEMITAMTAWLFFHPNSSIRLDYFIFEVGMGGTWDATNAIPHGVSVITTLGLDHVPILGTTLAEVAANKFGIVQAGQTVVSQPLVSEVKPIAIQTQNATGTQIQYAPTYSFEVHTDLKDGIPFYILKSKWGDARLSLLGVRACENTNLALSVFESMGFDPKAHLDALSDITWPGRMERLKSFEHQAPVFFSGDHNPQGVESLLEILSHFKYETIYLVIAIGISKEADGMLNRLLTLPRNRFVLTTTHFMGRTEFDYPESVRLLSDGYIAKPIEALKSVNEKAKAKDLVLITGSLYMYEDILKPPL